MKILLAGASGLVGSAFARIAASSGHEVVGVVGRFDGELAGLARRCALDLTEAAATARVVEAERPEVIVNAAAISEPAACDLDPVRSEAMNVALPALLARLAVRFAARLLHISSEQVFDGERPAPYAVTDVPHPINRYGRQKLASEDEVRAIAGVKAAIVRAPLLMGDSAGGRRGLHERLLGDWAAGRTASLYVDEFRQPCTAENLARVLLELAGRPELTGVFHWAGADLLSRHVLGLRVREHFRLSEQVAPIVAARRAEAPEIARERPPCLALDLSPLAGRLQTQPQTIEEQLATLRVPAARQAWYRAARAGNA